MILSEYDFQMCLEVLKYGGMPQLSTFKKPALEKKGFCIFFT